MDDHERGLDELHVNAARTKHLTTRVAEAQAQAAERVDQMLVMHIEKKQQHKLEVSSKLGQSCREYCYRTVELQLLRRQVQWYMWRANALRH